MYGGGVQWWDPLWLVLQLLKILQLYPNLFRHERELSRDKSKSRSKSVWVGSDYPGHLAVASAGGQLCGAPGHCPQLPGWVGGRYRWAFAPVCDPLYVVKYQCRLNTSIQSEANTNGCNTQVIFIYFFLYCGVFLRVWLKIKLLIIKEITQV